MDCRVAALLAMTLLVLATPAEAQMRKPGQDFIPEPDWSPEFTKGMIAVQRQDLVEAEKHFLACVDGGKKIDPNCEYYLSLMYQAKGDSAGFRKWLNLAASHGQPVAVTTVDLLERYK